MSDFDLREATGNLDLDLKDLEIRLLKAILAELQKLNARPI